MATPSGPTPGPSASPRRRTVLPDARISPRFAGLATFGRYPRLDDVAPENRPLDWAIYGVPYDTGVTFRPGARFGPRAIRDASQYLKRYHIEHAVDVCDTLSMADCGDAPVLPFDPRKTLDAVAEFATDLADESTRLLAIGGDHSIAYANLRATFTRLAEHGREPKGGLAVVHFDSHLDTVDAVWGERWSHASPFRRAIEEGLINPKRMLTIGIKGPLNGAADLDYARQAGVTVVLREDLRRAGAPGIAVIREFLGKLGDTPTYITFDIDVVDPAFAPGTGTPSVGGLSSIEALELLRMCRGINIAGGDVVEVLPDRDVSQITAFLAAHIAFEILALDAARQ
jgi:agmatinase